MTSKKKKQKLFLVEKEKERKKSYFHSEAGVIAKLSGVASDRVEEKRKEESDCSKMTRLKLFLTNREMYFLRGGTKN